MENKLSWNYYDWFWKYFYLKIDNMIMLYTNCDGILKKKLIEKDGGK